MNEDYIKNITKEVNTRYPNRDAEAYFYNCNLIYENYNNDWENLLEETKYSAPRLVDELKDKGFKMLKGDKLAPFYARVLNDEYKELDNLW